MPIIENEKAKKILVDSFDFVESGFLQNKIFKINKEIAEPFEGIFNSETQAYREVLLGCIIARIINREVNIRLPYSKLSADAFSGRGLDEKVVNPILQEKRIPCSKGPYLSVFRRSVGFLPETRGGLRDRTGYDNFLSLLSFIERLSDDHDLYEVLYYLIFKFFKLREKSIIPLTRLSRMSLEQYRILISELLKIPSLGRFPVMLTVAAFKAIKYFFNLNWIIEYQGINVADSASGSGGDITIKKNDNIILSAEITERPIDKNRVVSTFNTKINPIGIEEYLFFTNVSNVDNECLVQSHHYFTQGYEVNFIEIKDWILMTLATIGKKGREKFNEEMLKLLDNPDVPNALKTSWNYILQSIIS